MTVKIDCLDHGFVRLIDYMGGDINVVRAARVSYDAAWRAGEDDKGDAKLINYLWSHHHTTPFEAVTFTFEVKAPIFVIRQWHRHRTWCLKGDTKISFSTPGNGKNFNKTIKNIAEMLEPKINKRDRHPRKQHEYNKELLSKMLLRYRSDSGELKHTKLVDCWKSSQKQLYKITAGKHTIEASEDHLFLTSKGYVKASELTGLKCIIYGQGSNKTINKITPLYTDNEIWSEIVPGYEISSHGRVKSYLNTKKVLRKEPKILQPVINANGRVVVNILGKVYQVSRLVANAFLTPMDNKNFVCHIDDNSLNNHISNIKFCDAKDNQDDCSRNGTRSFGNFIEVTVDSVEKTTIEDVYDITVEADEHNFIANKFVVHNCYNELSARYRELPEEFYIPKPEHIGEQSKSNKQARVLSDKLSENAERQTKMMRDHNEDAFDLYRTLLETGMPRELARSVLPVSTYTHMFATVNLLNLLKFLTLRTHSHAQYEIRVYAEAMLELIREIVPVSVVAWEKTNVK